MSDMPVPRTIGVGSVTEAQQQPNRTFRAVSYYLQELLATVDKSELATLENWRWARSIIDSRAFRIQGITHLVPFADFFNFASHEEKRGQSHGDHFLRYHRIEEGSFTVYADRSAVAGTQLLEDYGDNDNEIYMLYHGFVPSDNQFACWQFPLPSSSVLRRRQYRALRAKVLEAVVSKFKHTQSELCLTQGQPIPNIVYRAIYVAYASGPQLAKCKQFASQPGNQSAVEECFWPSPPTATIKTVWQRTMRAFNYTQGEMKAFELTAEEQVELEQLQRLAATLTHGDNLAPLSSKLWQKQLHYKYLLAKQRVISSLLPVIKDDLGALVSGTEVAARGGTPAIASRSARLDLKENKLKRNSESVDTKTHTVREQQDQPEGGRADFTPAREPLPTVGVQDSAASPAQLLSSTVQVFNAWVASFSPAVLKIEAAVVGGGMRLGVLASQDLQPEEVYLSLPPDAVMSAQSARRSALEGTFADLDSRFPRGDAYHELLFHLMFEAFVLGQNSTWAPYIATLPTSAEMGFPLFYSERQLEQLQGMPIVRSVRANRQQLRAKFNGIKSAVFHHYPDTFPPHVRAVLFSALAFVMTFPAGVQLAELHLGGRDP